jgi:hypothetical protein
MRAGMRLRLAALTLAACTGCGGDSVTEPATGTLIGQVFDHGGTLAHGAVVWARPLAGPETASPAREAVTDAEGRFRFDGIASGAWLLVVDHSAVYAAAETVNVPGDALVRLRPACAVAGHAALEGLGRAGSIAVGAFAPEAATVTAAGGGYFVAGLPAGTWTLHFSRDCYRDTTSVVTLVVAGATLPVTGDVTLTAAADRDTVLCPGLPDR